MALSGSYNFCSKGHHELSCSEGSLCLSRSLHQQAPYLALQGKPSVEGSCPVFSRSGDQSPIFCTFLKVIAALRLILSASEKESAIVENVAEIALVFLGQQKSADVS